MDITINVEDYKLNVRAAGVIKIILLNEKNIA